MRQKCPFSPLLFNIVLEILATALRQVEKNKGIHRGKEVIKLSLFPDNITLYVKYPENSTKKYPDIIDTFS
jgi:hypothetical protein